MLLLVSCYCNMQLPIHNINLTFTTYDTDRDIRWVSCRSINFFFWMTYKESNFKTGLRCHFWADFINFVCAHCRKQPRISLGLVNISIESYFYSILTFKNFIYFFELFLMDADKLNWKIQHFKCAKHNICRFWTHKIKFVCFPSNKWSKMNHFFSCHNRNI